MITQVTQTYAALRTLQNLNSAVAVMVCDTCYASYDALPRAGAVRVTHSAHSACVGRNLRNGVLYMPESPLFIVLCSLLLSLFFCVTNKKRVVTDSNFLKIQTISKGGFFEIV